MSSESNEIILGVDPGTTVCGYGCIQAQSSGSGFTPIDYGCIRPPARYQLSHRYLTLYDSLRLLIAKLRPTVLVLETQFVHSRHNNVQSAIKLSMARGIAMLVGKQQGLSIYEYAPTQAKKAVVGNGKASKLQVQYMVQKYLNLPELPQPDDAADALALALCYAHTADYLKPNYET